MAELINCHADKERGSNGLNDSGSAVEIIPHLGEINYEPTAQVNSNK